MNNKVKSMKLWVRTHTNHTSGNQFATCSIMGKYIRKDAVNHNAPIQDNEYYDVRLVRESWPLNQDGQYKVFFSSAWVDEKAPEGKFIIRIMGNDENPIQLEFLKPSDSKK